MVPLYYELLGGVFGCGSELAIGHGVLGDLVVADGSWRADTQRLRIKSYGTYLELSAFISLLPVIVGNLNAKYH